MMRPTVRESPLGGGQAGAWGARGAEARGAEACGARLAEVVRRLRLVALFAEEARQLCVGDPLAVVIALRALVAADRLGLPLEQLVAPCHRTPHPRVVRAERSRLAIVEERVEVHRQDLVRLAKAVPAVRAHASISAIQACSAVRPAGVQRGATGGRAARCDRRACSAVRPVDVYVSRVRRSACMRGLPRVPCAVVLRVDIDRVAVGVDCGGSVLELHVLVAHECPC